MAYGKSIPESVAGASAIAFALVTPFLRRRRIWWGTTPEERQRAWPGDELIPVPNWQSTMAVSVNAAPERVWPWIAQLGQGRGGFYSYEHLENLIGCGIENATRVLDGFQAVALGDPIRLHRQAAPLTVARVEPGRVLVLHGNPAGSGPEAAAALDSTWALMLEPLPSGATRLVCRMRYRHGPGFRNALMGGPAVVEPVSFVMARKMLTVIKRLAEAAS